MVLYTCKNNYLIVNMWEDEKVTIQEINFYGRKCVIKTGVNLMQTYSGYLYKDFVFLSVGVCV